MLIVHSDIFFGERLNMKMDHGLTTYDTLTHNFCSNKSRKGKEKPLQQLAQKSQELTNNGQLSLFLPLLSNQDQRKPDILPNQSHWLPHFS